jgi:hypothetical protein
MMLVALCKVFIPANVTPALRMLDRRDGLATSVWSAVLLVWEASTRANDIVILYNTLSVRPETTSIRYSLAGILIQVIVVAKRVLAFG